MKENTKRLFAWCAVLLVMTAIFLFSSETAAESTDTSDSVIDKFLGVIIPDFDEMSEEGRTELVDRYTFAVRKSAHFSICLLLGVTVYAAVSRYEIPKTAVFSISFVICGLYSVSDEIHQFFVPGRSCEARDVLVDCAGALVGITAMILILCRKNGKEK